MGMTPNPTRMPRRWPLALGWSACLLVAVGAVFVLAWVVGRPPSPGEPGVIEALDRTLHRDEVAAALTIGLLTAAGWSLRRVWLELLGWLPGRIDVESVRLDGEIDGVDAERLTMELRRRLARRRLQAAAAVPGAPPSTDFVGVLGDVRPDPPSILAALGRLVRSVKPTHAYEVAVTVTVRPEEPRYDASVEVTRLPHEGISSRTVTDTSWDGAVQRAADAVVAAVLPQTRLCRAPWTGWRRYTMDADMVHAHERACQLTSERRYDEALDDLYLALSLDPRNIDLRLQIGFVQEKLGLYLDAVAMYLSARTVVASDDGRVYSRRARRERRASAWIAGYRMAILLAGPNVAEQWQHPTREAGETERDAQRAALRERVRGALRPIIGHFRLVGSRSGPMGPPWTATELEELLADPPSEGREDLFPLRALFVQIACAELEQLGHEVRFSARRPNATLSPAAVRLASVLMDMRRRWIRHRVLNDESVAWRVDPDQLAVNVRKIGGRRWAWTEEYNAACIFAAPMLVATVQEDPPRADRFAGYARERLQRAMASATSAAIAARRDWVVSEDPDLAALRRHEEFKQFEAMYLPSATRTPHRPKLVQRWQMSRFTRALILGSAERWEGFWQRRGRELAEAVDAGQVLGWLQDEAETWRLIDRVAEHHRHWRVRLELITQMASASKRLGFAPLDAAVPPFDDRWIDDARACGVARGVGDDEEVAERDVRWANERLDVLHDLLADWLTNELPASSVSVREHDLEGRPLAAADVAALCTKHAAMWRRLREWMAPPEADSAPRTEENGEAVMGLERTRRAPRGRTPAVVSPAVPAVPAGRGTRSQRLAPLRFGPPWR